MLGLIIAIVEPTQARPRKLTEWLSALLLEPWNQYDVNNYLRIAEDGYTIQDGRGAFHPLLPLLMRIIGDLLGGQYLLAGLVVSNVACILLLAAFYRLIELDFDPKVARYATRWLLCAPTGFILLIPYTESLVLCFVVLTFWFARRNAWLSAGICGCIASLAKQPGVVLVLPLLWEYVRVERRNLFSWKSVGVLLSLSLIPLGYIGFALYRTLVTSGSTMATGWSVLPELIMSKQVNQTWGSRFGWPWEWAANVVAYMPAGDIIFWLELLLGIFAIFALVKAGARTSSAVNIWSVTQVLLVLTMILATEPLLSLPRRFMLMFPIFLQLGLWSVQSRRATFWMNIGLGASMLLAGMFITHRFIP